MYEGSGSAGHYFSFTRESEDGKSYWMRKSDESCTKKNQFVPKLKNVSYMILERKND